MAQNTATDEEPATMDDLVNEVPSAGFRLTNNNEEVSFYPDARGAEFGVIKHEYKGLPARGVVLYDVVGWEIVDMDFETMDEDATMEEDFEHFESEIREWISEALFSSEMSSTEGNMSHVDTHTIEVTNPYEGDSYTVKLETANKCRVR